LARRYINKQIIESNRMFAWAVEDGIGLRCGATRRCCESRVSRKARQPPGKSLALGPCPGRRSSTSCLLWPETVRAMIQVQRLCGCRPQEVVEMRAAEIEENGSGLGVPSPPLSKPNTTMTRAIRTASRIIFWALAAQAVLQPLLTDNPEGLFVSRPSDPSRPGTACGGKLASAR